MTGLLYVTTRAGMVHLTAAGEPCEALCGRHFDDPDAHAAPIGLPRALAMMRGGARFCRTCRRLLREPSEAALLALPAPCPYCARRGRAPRHHCPAVTRLEHLSCATYARWLRRASWETYHAQRVALAALYRHIGEPAPLPTDRELAAVARLPRPLSIAAAAASAENESRTTITIRERTTANV